MSRMAYHHTRGLPSDDLSGSQDYSSESNEAGKDRILDVVNQKELDRSSTGTVSLNQMAQVFRMFNPDEDQTISAEGQDNIKEREGDPNQQTRRRELKIEGTSTLQNDLHCVLFVLIGVCTFLRTKLGYRPDPTVIASLFSDLNRRVSGRDDVAQASTSSNPAIRRAAQATQMVSQTDDREMHINTFIQVLRNATNPKTNYSDHIKELDPELDELLRSLELLALNSDQTRDDGQPLPPNSGLLSIKTLKHRMHCCRGDKLDDEEMAKLIEFAGQIDHSRGPLFGGSSAAGLRGLDGFIPYKQFVQRLAVNKPVGDV